MIPEAPPSIDELHERIRRQLTGRQREIFDVLVCRNEISREELAGELGMHPRTKSFLNALGRLRSLGFIDYESGGIVATDLMFPSGIA